MTQKSCICIHSHFYQPPREDPWLDAVMKDLTASPSHDWNTRVYDECYKPNRAARLLDQRGDIVYINNNYKHMSFNVGPTLHSWIVKHDPILAQSIVDADRCAEGLFGAGGAIAQAYNHMILPLSVDRDIKTQVVWGVKDFIYRYGRRPKGMWLPETAVNTASLEALASEGIEFTILAPHQCEAVLPPHDSWRLTPGGQGLDVTRPYLMQLPSGAAINIVFYYGSIAHDIAFGGLLDNGDHFADSLISKVVNDDEPRLLTIATDGETYGHHHRFGEMALARAIQRLSDSPSSMLTNIASFLDQHPTTWQCKIAEDTSWSCAHGIERWRSNCGCHTGGGADWNQMWRAPLRSALDNIRDKIDEIYEKEMKRFCDSPWALRDEAISLYLMNFSERSDTSSIFRRKKAFLRDFCGDIPDSALGRALSLIEMQRMRMFMYTSCGWFFNDISGIETRQILSYADRAVEYAESLSGIKLNDSFSGDLKKAVGNTKDLSTGYEVLKRCVVPLRRTAQDIAASAALLANEKSYYAFRVESQTRTYPSGDMEIRVGNINITDVRTTEGWSGSFAVVSTGGLNDVCRLSDNKSIQYKTVQSHFYEGDILSVSKYLESAFEYGSWHLHNLPLDDKEKIAAERTKYAERGHLEHAEDLLRDNQRLLVQLKIMGVTTSALLLAAGGVVFSHKLSSLSNDYEKILDLLKPDSKLEFLLNEAHSMGIYPEVSVLAEGMERAFYDNLYDAGAKNDSAAYTLIKMLWDRADELGITIDRWRLQNGMWAILDENDSAPSEQLLNLAKALGFATPQK